MTSTDCHPRAAPLGPHPSPCASPALAPRPAAPALQAGLPPSSPGTKGSHPDPPPGVSSDLITRAFWECVPQSVSSGLGASCRVRAPQAGTSLAWNTSPGSSVPTGIVEGPARAAPVSPGAVEWRAGRGTGCQSDGQPAAQLLTHAVLAPLHLHPDSTGQDEAGQLRHRGPYRGAHLTRADSADHWTMLIT